MNEWTRLHTAEVADSNPASPALKISYFAGLSRDQKLEATTTIQCKKRGVEDYCKNKFHYDRRKKAKKGA